MKTSKCCKKEAIFSHTEQKYFCGGVPGCGKWCEVEEETPDWEKKFDEQLTHYDNWGTKCLNKIFVTEKKRIYPIVSKEEQVVIKLKQFISDTLQKDREQFILNELSQMSINDIYNLIQATRKTNDNY